MNYKTKKIILIALMIIFIAIFGVGIYLFTNGLIENEHTNQIVGLVLTNISPFSIILFLMRIIQNDKLLLEIEKIHKEYGLTKSSEDHKQKQMKINNLDMINLIMNSKMSDKNKLLKIKEIINDRNSKK